MEDSKQLHISVICWSNAQMLIILQFRIYIFTADFHKEKLFVFKIIVF